MANAAGDEGGGWEDFEEGPWLVGPVGEEDVFGTIRSGAKLSQ